MRLLFLFLFSFLGICSIYAQQSAHPDFNASIDYMQPMKYPSRNVTSDFYLKVKGDSADIYLPYIGEVQVAPFGNDGIHFKEPLKEVKTLRNKKDNATIMDFQLSHDIVDYRFSATIYDNSKFDLFMQPSNGQNCRYSGEWEEVASTHSEVIPKAPDYKDDTMWYVSKNDTDGSGADVFYVVSTWEFDWTTADGQKCHYADVWNKKHRDHMAIEQKKVAEYMAEGNNFYAPYYRHITLDTWATLNEDTIHRRAILSMGDVKKAFDYFIAHRDNSRPLVIAGFSQGGLAVVELLKHMSDETYKHLAAAYVLGYKVTAQDTTVTKHIIAAKDSADVGVTICYNSVKDVKYIQPIISSSIMCINPVNWRTDATPAIIKDTITVTMSPEHNVLVLKNYSASEYKPILGILNVGDIHSCEPWLYSDCLRKNIKLRIRNFKNNITK